MAERPDINAELELLLERLSILQGAQQSTVITPANSFVLKNAAATPGNNVYTSMAALAPVITSVQGPASIEIDPSAGAVTIPAAPGGTWNLRPNGEFDIEIRGIATQNFGANAAVTIQGPIKGVGRVTDLAVTYNSASDFMTTAVAAGSPLLVLDNANIACSGAGVFYSTSGTGFGVVRMYKNASFQTGTCVNATGTTTLVVEVADSATLNNNTLGSVVGATNLVQLTSGAGLVSTSQAAALGTLTYSRIAKQINDGIQAGTATYTNGVSPGVACSLSANSKIVFSYKALNASTAIAVPLTTTRTNGVNGTGAFVVTSTRLATLATETGDQSTLDWVIIDTGSTI